MSSYRILGEGRSFYHCVSRVVDRRFVFENQDKAVFRKILRVLERFSGVRVVTYCVMSNHFHVLLDVPDREALAPLRLEELLDLLPELHDPAVAEGVRQEIERALASERAEERDTAWRRERVEMEVDGAGGSDPNDLSRAGGCAEGRDGCDSGNLPGGLEEGAFWDGAVTGVEGILERYERRRGDLSMFMKMLKQRMTIYMNHRLDRVGTLWESRFKSVLVEGDERALMAVASYIDLNPVRAGMVSSPEDFPWSGFGEAASKGSGAKRARQGLGTILREALGPRGQDAEGCGEDWRRTLRRYRIFLYERGKEPGGDPVTGEGVPSKVAGAEIVGAQTLSDDSHLDLPSGGHAPEPEALIKLARALSGMLQTRVRYFSDGAAFGSGAFIEAVFEREQAHGRLGAKRRSGARRMRGADWGPLRVLRDLRKAVFDRAG